MKIADALKIIDDNWVQKPQGFRVCMQRREGSEWVTVYSPGEKAAPLDSDVAAWRTAWKLAQSTPLKEGEPQEGDMVKTSSKASAQVIYFNGTITTINPTYTTPEVHHQLKDAGASLLITRPDMPTMPVVIYRALGRPGQLNYGMALAMSTILMAVSALSLVVIERFRIGDIGEF